MGMSGRYFLTARTGILSELFSLGDGRDESGRTVSRGPLELKPRYNVAPGQEVAIVRAGAVLDHSARTPAHGAAGSVRRELAMVRWGLIPTWASAADVGVRVTACPVEGGDVVPSRREAFQSRRCLIPADGFYEWRTGECGVRRPVLVRYRSAAERAGVSTFGIAGLFDRWMSSDGSVTIESCTMLTVPSNGVVKPLSERMPAVVRPQDYSAWLGDGGAAIDEDTRRIKDLCRVWPDELTAVSNVSAAVNSPRFDDPRCLEVME